ncbi:MAG: hypothetical protein DLM58_00075 [Pseudonocardiales bacterium]|nr:MAG: hypothetical protein DLM58_00075 [Pseudonocardiales bacterium]
MMALFHRREAPPATALAALSKGERVVSWAQTESDDVVLATPRGLWWPDADGLRLIGWEYVDKAIWREGRLTVIEADLVDDLLLIERAPKSVELSTPRDLPATVRKRVESNVVRSELRAVGGGVARFVARRIPGRDGVLWWVRLEGGLVDTDEVRSQIDAERAVLQAQWAQAQF